LALQVVLVAPPWYPVPPHGYGGIELVVSLLDRELRRRGHRVTVIASDGSPGAVPCAPRHWDADLGSPQQGVREATYATNVMRTLDKLGPVDVLHDHAGTITLAGLAFGGRAPVLHTVHGPLTDAERDLYRSLGGAVDLVAISDSQRESAPEQNWVGRVHNAVDFDSLEVADPSEKRPYLLCLARICEDKGQHIAIEVARRAGLSLVLAGKVEPNKAGKLYFEERIAPHIDGTTVVHIPNAAGAEKARLLSRARAALAPIQWAEPFGLAMVEAMASGTPVIATSRGAAPELIRHGHTGFLADNVDDMAAAVGESAEIDPEECAWETRTRFSPEAMAEGYLRVYESVAQPLGSAVA
jgi:glycosyltransferase involved in cell wall biosynthesis